MNDLSRAAHMYNLIHSVTNPVHKQYSVQFEQYNNDYHDPVIRRKICGRCGALQIPGVNQTHRIKHDTIELHYRAKRDSGAVLTSLLPHWRQHCETLLSDTIEQSEIVVQYRLTCYNTISLCSIVFKAY
ncbi:hypothetical protein KGF56_004793 [Candida oxycetoniae]|uniref:Uncharacterized protein n=1 Tax=Candida oxycetoniae TaxID=497107 RepID=A0AAI9SSJ8_9ASCO|nr:uncharacterized protein KGF56_004793 [Candida oxycetoniae]KAI3402385.1 hypothetical protein KGF56_004793 [Candida oxycetoniae]